MSKINRNDACPCGSGKKFKKCCIDKPAENKSAVFESAMENINKHWTDDKVEPMTNAQIFEKLGALGIVLNEEKFIEYAAQTVSSEKLTLRLEKEAGVDIVFVLGHPTYYPRSGFHPVGSLGFEAPYPIPSEHSDAWMVQALCPGILGTVTGKVLIADALDHPEHWVE